MARERFKKRRDENFYWCEEHDDEFPVVVAGAVLTRWGAGEAFDQKERDRMSVHIITAGNARYFQRGNEGLLEAGDIFFAHTGMGQRFESGPAGYVHKRSLFVTGTGIEHMLLTSGLKERDALTLKNPGRVLHLFRVCTNLLRTRERGYVQTCSEAAFSIFLEFINSIRKKYPPDIERVITYVDKHIQEPIDISTIAFVAQRSIRHISRLFQESLGVSPVQFVITRRIAIASNMLVHSTLPIKEIALSLGYEDPLYFSYQFKRITGVSPRQYRKNLH